MAALKTHRVSRSRAGNVLLFLIVALLGAFMVLPLVYAFVNSLKPINELFYYPPRFFVERPTFDNFLDLFRLQDFSLVPVERYAFNSVFTSVVTTGAYMFIASLAAYPLAKHRFAGRALLTQLIVWAILFRPEVTAIPQYMVMSKLGIINTYGSVIFPALAGSFGVFLMVQFMQGVPDEILESAQIDGAGQWRMWRSIVMPQVKPAWLTLLIFTFQGIWNATGTQFIYDEQLKMLPAALSQVAGGGFARAGASAAVAVLLMIPPIVIFMLCENSVIETMAHSGLKG